MKIPLHVLRPWMDIPLWQLYIGCCYSMYLIYDYRHEYCTLWLNEKYFSSEMSMDLQKSGTDCKPPTGMCLSLRLVPEAKCWENKPAFSLCFLSREMFLNGHISCLFLIFFPKLILAMVLALVLLDLLWVLNQHSESNGFSVSAVVFVVKFVHVLL